MDFAIHQLVDVGRFQGQAAPPGGIFGKAGITMRYLACGLAVCLVSIMGGCAKYVPFTQALVNEYELSANDLAQLQYYVSDKVTLQREIASSAAGRTGARLRRINDKLVEEVVVNRRTPGVAERVCPTRLEVSFEEGSSFIFAISDKFEDGLFRLTPHRISEDGAPLGKYVFDYRGKTYYSGNTDYIYLLVQREAISNYKKTTKKLPGRRINAPE